MYPPAGGSRGVVPIAYMACRAHTRERFTGGRSPWLAGAGHPPATGRRVRPYQLQAAIAYEHDRSASYAETDWDEILRLYDLLLTVAPSDPAALGRAVVVAERDGAEAGLTALSNLPADPRREAVRSELLAWAGRPAEAAAAVSVALAGDAPEAQKRYWRQRLATWQATSGSAGDRFVQ